MNETQHKQKPISKIHQAILGFCLSLQAFMGSIHPVSAQPYLYTVSMDDNVLRVVDPLNAQVVDSLVLTMEGTEITGAQGLATNPLTGELWGMFNGNVLATIDPASGIVNNKNTGQEYLGLAFDGNGVLYGLASEGETLSCGPEQTADEIQQLYSIPLQGGIPQLVLDLGEPGGFGLDFQETIGYGYLGGEVLWVSGRGGGAPEQIRMEFISPGSAQMTPVSTSGEDRWNEIVGATYWPETGLMLLSAARVEASNRCKGEEIEYNPTAPEEGLYTLGIEGEMKYIGPLPHRASGIAFAEPQELAGPRIGRPFDIDFGLRESGTTTTRQVSIVSTGTEPLVVQDISIHPSCFKALGFDGPITLAPGQSFQFEVQFSIQESAKCSGELSFITNSTQDPWSVELQAEGIIVTPAYPGDALVGTGRRDGGRLLSLDLTSGEGQIIGETGLVGLPGIAIDRDGYIYGVSAHTGVHSPRIYKIDGLTGRAVQLAVVEDIDGGLITDLAFDEEGELFFGEIFWGTGWTGSGIYSINPQNGQNNQRAFLTATERGAEFDAVGMAFAPESEGILWAGTRSDTLISYDFDTRTITSIKRTGIEGSISGLFFDSQENFYGIKGGRGSESSQLIQIDPDNGTGEIIGPIGYSSVSSAAISPPRDLDAYPFISDVAIPIVGDSLTLSVDLPDAYDSSIVFANAMPITTIGSNQVGQFDLPIAFPSAGRQELRLVGYKNLVAFPSNGLDTDLLRYREIEPSYSESFGNAQVSQNFLQLGLQDAKQGSLNSAALHSPHPYPNGARFTTQLMIPIEIAQAEALFQYKDIALVEPDADYVVVEGSLDGINWTPIAEAYDASYDDSWETLYTTGSQDISSEFYREHSIDLLATFSPGDVVVFRFRMETDGQNIGWGWAIDDLRIQDPNAVTSVEEEQPEERMKFRIIPNPVSGEAVFSFRLAESGRVSYQVLNSLGAMVETRDFGFKTKGEQSINWESGYMDQGLYLVRLITNGGVVMERMIVR